MCAVAKRSGQEETPWRRRAENLRGDIEFVGSKADAADRFFAHARRWDTSVDVGRGTGGARRRSRRCNAYEGSEYDVSKRLQPILISFG